MIERQRVRAPDKPPSLLGMGPYTRGALFLGLAAVGYLGAAYGPAYMNQYQAKTFAKTACNDYVLEIRRNVVAEGVPHWENTFLANMRGLGIQLTPDQYTFKADVEPGKDTYDCMAHIAFEQKSEWPLIATITEVEKIRTVHRLKFTHSVRRTY